ncbi:Apoptosis-resistant E3 ubiquitin protein ligase 1 [Dermatophagoides pteronyssinus]|uniref:HECT-type E3 ubiquitin transferase n=1 Tax=Dermatophagoides pteronyssinus TaxID=6956 RepID=A0ABQ8JVZ0_DERPT|nr:Apoptosis-resistant E3 ubiquitin protein ligase 1 [Dermatophagoides pteronyssinus]
MFIDLSVFLFGSVSFIVIPWIIWKMISNIQFSHKEGKSGFLTFITGSYLAPQNCKVIFDWQSPTTVSNLATFIIKFYQRNHKPYPITADDRLSVHITNGLQVVPCSIEFGDLNPSLANIARVSFSPKKSGNYTINILVGNTFTHLRGSPFTDIYFEPLTPSPHETLFVNHCSTVVCIAKNLHALIIETRDRFGNLCLLDSELNKNFDESQDFQVTFTEISTEQQIDTCYYWKREICDNSRIVLIIAFELSGVYHALVSYKGTLLKNGDFNIVCLTENESEIVKKCTLHSKSCYFNARLLPPRSQQQQQQQSSKDSTNEIKLKNVVCFISPKQLKIEKYFLKIIPKRLSTFRLLPSTKFYFKRNNHLHNNSDLFPLSTSSSSTNLSSYNDDDLPNQSTIKQWEPYINPEEFIMIDDGAQTPIELITPQRNIIVAIFTYFLLNRIGGSESFRDKQDFFYSEVRRHHQKTNYLPGRIHLKISRENLLDSSMKAVRSSNDWLKKFKIEFIGEIGIDWGGLRREWYTLLCKTLFDPKPSMSIDNDDTPLFIRFKQDKQGLIHLNPHCKRFAAYEFAGRLIGKCLLDSSFCPNEKCLINARFCRSFLAQWIGLRVNYRYFEQDDPDLYIKYDLNGKLIRIVDLIPNGSNIRVTEANKIRYLDALAQYRLSIKCKDQMSAFLKGLNDLIPDNLLSIFDENEIELLVCGATTYSLSDLRLNHVVTGAIYDFQKIIDWFWRSLANFSDEEFGRLLQFTTGCSILPPGGFSELNPRFQITSSLTYGTLPTAHTCFNQICLPDYDTFDDFDRSLRIAITEGSEGFGLV